MRRCSADNAIATIAVVVAIQVTADGCPDCRYHEREGVLEGRGIADFVHNHNR